MQKRPFSVVPVGTLPNAVAGVSFGSYGSLQTAPSGALAISTYDCDEPLAMLVPFTTTRYVPAAALAISTSSVLSTVFTPRVAGLQTIVPSPPMHGSFGS